MLKLKPEDIKYLIVHHSATSRDFTTFAAIKKYHIEVNKWEDIGYHYLITGNGKLLYGRHVEFIGDHCKTPAPSMNLRSLGLCLTGNFENEQPSDAQLITLNNILLSLKNGYNIPIKNILGHCEAPAATLCPGKNLLTWLKTWRSEQEKKTPLGVIAAKIKEIATKIQELIVKIRGFHF